MLSAEAQCQIISVEDVKERKGFKTCSVRIRTHEKRDPDTRELIRESGTFDCEVIANNDERLTQLRSAAKDPDVWLPCFFILRSFEYQEKNITKLGKQLQLKRWWR